MATKWKNLNNRKTRIGAVCLLFLSIAMMLFSISTIIKYNLGPSYMQERNFLSSNLLNVRAEVMLNKLMEINTYYKSEENIRAGNTVNQERLQHRAQQLANEALSDSGYYYEEMEWGRTGYFFYNNGSIASPYEIIYLNGGISFYPYHEGFNYSEYLGEGTPGTGPGTKPRPGLSGSDHSAESGMPNQIQTNEESLYITEDKNEQYLFDYATDFSLPQNYTIVNQPLSEDDLHQLSENAIFTYHTLVQLFEDQAKESLISEDLDGYYSLLSRVNVLDIYYYSSSDSYVTRNSDYDITQFTEMNAYYIYRDKNKNTNISSNRSSDRLHSYLGGDSVETVGFAFGPTYYNELYNTWFTLKTLSSFFIPGFFMSFIVFLLTGAFLLYFTGKPYDMAILENSNGPRPGSHIPHIPNGKIYTDLAVVGIMFIVAASIVIIAKVLFYSYFNMWNLENIYIHNYISPSFFVMALLVSLTSAIFITALLASLLWDYKNKRLIRHSIIYILCAKMLHLLANISDIMNLGYRLISARKIRKVKEGIERIRLGNFSEPIHINGFGHMAQIAAGLNDISAGFNIAVENRIKSERLKTELISNVSHDIRTPLTSIITYVDLLQNGQNTEEEKQHYLEILDQKTTRLKYLIDDLFEASKASSGNIQADITSIDLNHVLEQAMGELEDKIEASGLHFKISKDENSNKVLADGKLLWRVIHNLFSNIFNYAMPGSRVYIDIAENDGYQTLTFKNMSATELNLSADDLMERCTRGDSARNSEGSGLGLNIAKSLVEIMAGELIIELDGDLFKATVKLPQ